VSPEASTDIAAKDAEALAGQIQFPFRMSGNIDTDIDPKVTIPRQAVPAPAFPSGARSEPSTPSALIDAQGTPSARAPHGGSEEAVSTN
jgi:hypothetical protein